MTPPPPSLNAEKKDPPTYAGFWRWVAACARRMAVLCWLVAKGTFCAVEPEKCTIDSYYHLLHFHSSGWCVQTVQLRCFWGKETVASSSISGQGVFWKRLLWFCMAEPNKTQDEQWKVCCQQHKSYDTDIHSSRKVWSKLPSFFLEKFDKQA